MLLTKFFFVIVNVSPLENEGRDRHSSQIGMIEDGIIQSELIFKEICFFEEINAIVGHVWSKWLEVSEEEMKNVQAQREMLQLLNSLLFFFAFSSWFIPMIEQKDPPSNVVAIDWGYLFSQSIFLQGEVLFFSLLFLPPLPRYGQEKSNEHGKIGWKELIDPVPIDWSTEETLTNIQVIQRFNGLIGNGDRIFSLLLPFFLHQKYWTNSDKIANQNIRFQVCLFFFIDDRCWRDLLVIRNEHVDEILTTLPNACGELAMTS